MEIYLNYSFIAWTAFLAFANRNNINLKSLIVVMMISKFADFAILTPLLQNFKSTASFFLIAHAINDLFMVMLIQYRWIISALIMEKSAFRRMKVETYIQAIYLASVFYNLLVITDYWRFSTGYGFFDRPYFYESMSLIKNAMNLAEAVVLTFLTMQTWLAVRKIKERGERKRTLKDDRNDYSQSRI